MSPEPAKEVVSPDNISLKVEPAFAEAGKFIPLNIKIANVDKVIISGIPSTAYLDFGKKNGNGDWELTPTDLSSVKLMLLPNYNGKLQLVVKATSQLASGNTHTISEKLEVTVSAEDVMQIFQKEFTPVTFWQKLLAGILLILTTVVVAVLWFNVFSEYGALSSKQAELRFKLPDGYTLRSGPVEFRYEAESGKERLIHIGPIDKERKKILIGLLSKMGNIQSDDDGNDTSKSQASATIEESEYWSAIDNLTFMSHSENSIVLKSLLLLAGLSGILGVQIRSIINFIGVACIKNSLDIKRWWPWYILRPVQGFLLGLLAVLIIKAGIFLPDGSVPSGTNWWLAITILVGFGAEDFTERLRLVSQAMFGKTK